MAEATTIARPYAQAAFDQAQKQGDLKGWSGVLESLKSIMGNAEVLALASSPKVSVATIESLVLSLAGTSLTQHQQNFVRILADGHRLSVASEISEMYELLRAEAEKSVDVTVSSAFDLSDAQQQKIVAALKVRMGREIRLSCKLDKELVGGIVIRAGDKVIDGSARTRLSDLTNALA
jgi:F-type H+-transporting ATPase subunit delta